MLMNKMQNQTKDSCKLPKHANRRTTYLGKLSVTVFPSGQKPLDTYIYIHIVTHSPITSIHLMDDVHNVNDRDQETLRKKTFCRDLLCMSCFSFSIFSSSIVCCIAFFQRARSSSALLTVSDFILSASDFSERYTVHLCETSSKIYVKEIHGQFM